MITDIDFRKEIEESAGAVLPYLAPQEVDRIAAVLASGTEKALAKIQSQPGASVEQKASAILAAATEELQILSRDMGVRDLSRVIDLGSFVQRIISKI